MAGRYSKTSGAIMLDLPTETEVIKLRRFKPDFYVPSRKAVPLKNLVPRTQREFGKRIVQSVEKSLARRAPLGLLGPLGDLAALGLVGYDLWWLWQELQRMRNEMAHTVPGDPSSWSDGDGNPLDPSRADAVWGNTWAAQGWTNIVALGEYLTDEYWTGPLILPFTPPDTDLNLIEDTATWGTWGEGRAPWQGPSQRTNIALDGYGYDFTDGGETFQETWTYGHGEGLPWDLPLDWMEPDPNFKRNFSPDGVNETRLDDEPMKREERKFERERRFRPRPPKAGEREKKHKKGLKYLEGIFKILDDISEAAEFVDALYDSLPEDVRHEWEEKQGGHWGYYNGKWRWIIPSRGLADTAGQYGLDGADWKGQALWHNWHKVDPELAMRKIIANWLQDRVIGDISRNLPVNVGHALDAGTIGVNDVLDWIFENGGLT